MDTAGNGKRRRYPSAEIIVPESSPLSTTTTTTTTTGRTTTPLSTTTTTTTTTGRTTTSTTGKTAGRTTTSTTGKTAGKTSKMSFSEKLKLKGTSSFAQLPRKEVLGRLNAIKGPSTGTGTTTNTGTAVSVSPYFTSSSTSSSSSMRFPSTTTTTTTTTTTIPPPLPLPMPMPMPMPRLTNFNFQQPLQKKWKDPPLFIPPPPLLQHQQMSSSSSQDPLLKDEEGEEEEDGGSPFSVGGKVTTTLPMRRIIQDSEDEEEEEDVLLVKLPPTSTSTSTFPIHTIPTSTSSSSSFQSKKRKVEEEEEEVTGKGKGKEREVITISSPIASPLPTTKSTFKPIKIHLSPSPTSPTGPSGRRTGLEEGPIRVHISRHGTFTTSSSSSSPSGGGGGSSSSMVMKPSLLPKEPTVGGVGGGKGRNPILDSDEDDPPPHKEEDDLRILYTTKVSPPPPPPPPPEESSFERDLTTFLNTAPPSSLQETLGCTDVHLAFLMSSRPLQSYNQWMTWIADSMVERRELVGLGKLVGKYWGVLGELGGVEGVLGHCFTVSQEINDILKSWKVSRLTSQMDPKLPPKFQPPPPLPPLLRPPSQGGFTLKEYQVEGVHWLYLLYLKGLGGILADEMGLGKTCQVISFLSLLYSTKVSKGPHLIVVPSTTLGNWVRELELWAPHLKVVSYIGPVGERSILQYEIEKGRPEVVVTTYTIATGGKVDRRWLRGGGFQTLILDEGHMIKNGESQRSKNLTSLKIPFKLLLTGTPLQNNLMELLSLLTFIMPSLFNGEVQKNFGVIFDRKALERGGRGGGTLEDDMSRRRIERGRGILAPFVLRRRKGDVLKDLPPKHRHIHYCKPNQIQKTLIHELMFKRREEMEEVESHSILDLNESKKGKKAASKKSSTPPLLLATLMELRKIANHQLLVRNLYEGEKLPLIAKELMREDDFLDDKYDHVLEDLFFMSDFQIHTLCDRYPKASKFALKEDQWMNSGKVNELAILLPSLKAKGDKILLFSQFVIMLDILENVMESLGMRYLRLDGSTPSDERLSLIDEYNTTPEITVFLLSTKACGLGINLTSANVVILYDIDFNPHNDNQAEDRAHRVGQTRPVEVYKFILEGSIEQHMLTCANFKVLLDDKIRQEEGDGAGKKLKGKDEEGGEVNVGEEGKLLEMLKNDMMNVSREEEEKDEKQAL